MKENKEFDMYIGDKNRREKRNEEMTNKLNLFCIYVLIAAVVYFILQVIRSFFL